VEDKPYSILNPLTGTTSVHTKDELEAVEDPDSTWDPTTRPISRTVTEATVVLFDASGSMNEAAFGPGDVPAFSPAGWAPPAAPAAASGGAASGGPEVLTRITCAKQLLYAFVNRCVAYNVPHAIALLPFCTGPVVPLKFTDNFSKFQNVVDDVAASGGTTLYDSVIRAVRGLVKLKSEVRVSGVGECHRWCAHRCCPCLLLTGLVVVVDVQYPSIERLHVICLSDGEDSASENAADVAAKFLVRHRVVMDSVMLGFRNRELKALCALSGA
jgi:hypothetical protein